MQVFHYEEHRLPFGVCQDECKQGFQGALPLPLQGELQRRIALLSLPDTGAK